MPARIGALNEAHVPKPDPDAVLVLFDASDGTKGSKWVKAEDAPKVIRLTAAGHAAMSAGRGYVEPQTWFPPEEAEIATRSSPSPGAGLSNPAATSTEPNTSLGPLATVLNGIFTTRPVDHTVVDASSPSMNVGGAMSTQEQQPMATRLGGYDADGKQW